MDRMQQVAWMKRSGIQVWIYDMLTDETVIWVCVYNALCGEARYFKRDGVCNPIPNV